MKRIVTYTVLIGFLLVIALPVFVQSNEKAQLIKKREEIEKEIALTNRLLNDTRNKKENSLHEYKLVQTKISSRNKLIKKLNEDIENTELEIQENTNKLIILKGELEKSKNEYSALIYYTFKNRNANLNFMYLLASNDISQFYARYVYLRQYQEYRKTQLKLIIKLKELIETNIIELNEKKLELVNIINKSLAEKALLISDQEEIENIVDKLKQQEEDLLKQIEEKKKIAKKLNNEIEALIKKEAKKNSYEMLTPADRIISNEFSANKGRLPWPTEKGIITDHFGEHEHPVIKNLRIRNNGIDITTVPNSKARAVFNGEVARVFTIKGANTTVMIRHGNYYTVYHNLINVKIVNGDIVNTKDYIGEVFSDKNNGQTILHFELWKELEKQNPEEWLSN